MKNKTNTDWVNEYQDFLSVDAAVVPTSTNEIVVTKIESWLNPSALSVFFKVLGIHLAVGSLSLSICHQFGMNPFNTEKSLAEWMMRVGGHNFCMIGCGVLFVGLSLLIAGYFLTVEEVNALKRTEFLQSLSLGVISLGLFAAFGTQVALSIFGLWLLGSLVGGFAATEAVWRLKRI